MRVEGRGLEHFGKGQFHLVGKRREMRGGNLVILVLDQVQMLDQQIAPPRPVAEQQLDLMGGGGVDLAALGGRLGALPSLARMFERADLLHVMDSLERLVLYLIRSTLISGMPDAKRIVAS